MRIVLREYFLAWAKTLHLSEIQLHTSLLCAHFTGHLSASVLTTSSEVVGEASTGELVGSGASFLSMREEGMPQGEGCHPGQAHKAGPRRLPEVQTSRFSWVKGSD